MFLTNGVSKISANSSSVRSPLMSWKSPPLIGSQLKQSLEKRGGKGFCWLLFCQTSSHKDLKHNLSDLKQRKSQLIKGLEEKDQFMQNVYTFVRSLAYAFWRYSTNEASPTLFGISFAQWGLQKGHDFKTFEDQVWKEVLWRLIDSCCRKAFGQNCLITLEVLATHLDTYT